MMFKQLLTLVAVVYLIQSTSARCNHNALLEYKPAISDVKNRVTHVVDQRTKNQTTATFTLSEAIRNANEAIKNEIETLNSVVGAGECIQRQKKKYNELATIELSQCNSHLNWTNVESTLQEINKITNRVNNLFDNCTLKSGFVIDRIRRCMANGLLDLETELELKSQIVLDAINNNLNAGISCVTLKRVEAIEVIKKISSDIQECASEEELTLQKVIINLTPKINELTARIEQLSYESSKQIANTHKFIYNIQNITVFSINSKIIELSQAAQSAQKPGSNLNGCGKTLTSSLSTVSQTGVTDCVQLSLVKINLLETKVSEISSYQLEVANSPANCIAKQTNGNGMPYTENDIKLIKSCIENVLENSQNKIFTISTEIISSAQITVSSYSSCTSQSKNTTLKELQTIEQQFNSCVELQVEDSELTLEEVIVNLDPKIRELNSTILKLSAQYSEIITTTQISIQNVNDAASYAINTKCNSLVELAQSVQRPSLYGCAETLLGSLSSVSRVSLETCSKTSITKLTLLQQQISVLSTYQSEVTNALVICVSEQTKQSGDNIVYSQVDAKLVKSCVEDLLNDVQTKISSLSNEVLTSTEITIETASTCITQSKTTILQEVSIIENNFDACVKLPEENNEGLTLQDVIASLKPKIQELSSTILKLSTEYSKKITNTQVSVQKIKDEVSNGINSKCNSLAKAAQSAQRPGLYGCAETLLSSLSGVSRVAFETCSKISTTKLVFLEQKISKLTIYQSEVTTAPESCVSRQTKQSNDKKGYSQVDVILVKSCVEDLLNNVQTKITTLSNEVETSTEIIINSASTCITQVNTTILEEVSLIENNFNACVKFQEEDNEQLTLQEVLTNLQPKIQELSLTISKLSSEYSEKITSTQVIIQNIKDAANYSLSSKFNALVKVAQSAQSSGLYECAGTVLDFISIISQVVFSTCSKTSVTKISILEQQISELSTYQLEVANSPGNCLAQQTKESDVDVKLVKSCIEDTLNNVQINISNTLSEVLASTELIIETASTCISQEKTLTLVQVSTIENSFDACVKDDKEQINKLQEVVDALQPQIQDLSSTLLKLITEYSKKLVSSHTLIKDIQHVSIHTISTQINSLAKHAQSVQKPGSNISTCSEAVTDSLSGLSCGSIIACSSISQIKLNFVEEKISKLSAYQSEVIASPGNCIAAHGKRSSDGNLGCTKVDARLVKPCIENVLKTVQSKISSLSNEITISTEITTKSASTCITEAEDSLLEEIAEIASDFDTCVQTDKKELTLQDVINSLQPKIQELSITLTELSIEYSQKVASYQAIIQNIQDIAVQTINTKINVISKTAQSVQISNSNLTSCATTATESLSVISQDSINSCVTLSSIKLNFLLEQTSKLSSYQLEVTNSPGNCVAAQQIQNTEVDVKLVKACIENVLNNVQIKITNLTNEINTSAEITIKSTSTCINQAKVTIIKDVTIIGNNFDNCIETHQEDIVDIIGENKLRLNQIKALLAAFASEGNVAITQTTVILDRVAASCSYSIDSLLSSLSVSVKEATMPGRPINSCIEYQALTINALDKSVTSGCQGKVNWNYFNSLVGKISNFIYSIESSIADKCQNVATVRECFEESIANIVSEATTLLNSINVGINSQKQAAVDCMRTNEDNILIQITKVMNQFNICIQ